MRRLIAITLMLVLLGSMLAACGKSKPDTASAQGQPANGGGFRQSGPAADVIGKVVSVADGKLTIHKSTADPSAMQGGRGGGRGNGRPPADGAQGAAPNSGTAPGDGTQGTNPQVDQQAGDGTQTNRQRGGFGRAMQFSEEAVSYTFTDQTKVTTRSFGDNGMQTKEGAVSDLKAGDIIMIWLTDDKSGIASIQTMPSGGFGGGRGGAAGGAGGQTKNSAG